MVLGQLYMHVFTMRLVLSMIIHRKQKEDQQVLDDGIHIKYIFNIKLLPCLEYADHVEFCHHATDDPEAGTGSGEDDEDGDAVSLVADN